jgi:SAM-dependent methyltransferase
MSYRLSECPLCEGTRFTPLLRAKDYHYGNIGEFTLVQCADCTLCFQDPMYTDVELSNFYPKDYYSFNDRFSAPTGYRAFKATVGRLLGVREGPPTKDPKFERPGRMLDVGCGSGWFISKMRDKGWDVWGVEPNVAAAKYGAQKKGLDIFPGSLLDARFASESFDYVRLNHSFEHIEHPGLVLNEIHRIMANNGKLMIGVPNRAGFNARIFGPYWWHLALPLHTFSYSVDTLSRMLQKYRFNIEQVIYNSDHAGFQGSIQIYINRNHPLPRSQGRFFGSRLARLLCSWLAHIQNALQVSDSIEITATKQSQYSQNRKKLRSALAESRG